jgi:hypothetical protein
MFGLNSPQFTLCHRHSTEQQFRATQWSRDIRRGPGPHAIKRTLWIVRTHSNRGRGMGEVADEASKSQRRRKRSAHRLLLQPKPVTRRNEALRWSIASIPRYETASLCNVLI